MKTQKQIEQIEKIQEYKDNGYEVINTPKTAEEVKKDGYKKVISLGTVQVQFRDGKKTYNCFAVKA